METPLDTICTFLFGPNGHHAVDLFKVTTVALTALALEESLKDDELSPIALTASLAVLQRIVDLNQSAQVIADFTPIADTISAWIPEQLPLYAVRRSLARIRHRLGLGTSMASSENRSNKLQNYRAVFELGQDLPGMLSEKGPRHDNDHENIRDIKILPTAEEIQSHRLEHLPSNDPTRNHLPGLKGLLDRQFRLLREDTIGQLRDAVHLELERLNHPPTAQSKPNNGARNITYHKVRLLRLAFDRRKGLQIVAEFEQPPALRKKGAAQREEWWESSKQLQIDALLCLLSSKGHTIFFSVCDPVLTPPLKKRNTEEELAAPSTGLNTDPRKAVDYPSLFKHADRATVMLSMMEDKLEDVTWIDNHIGKVGNLKQSLVEFPGILLPAFRPTLQALQQMSRTLDLPFSEFIAPVAQNPGVANIPPPAYSRGRGFAFSLDPLTGGEPLKLKPGKQFDYQMICSKSTLDDAQQISTVNALSRCLALIQDRQVSGKAIQA